MNTHIECRNGVYYVKGTRISLDAIVYAFREGASAESIREDFEGLSLPNVYGAIAFYLDNQERVDGYLAERKNQWLEMERRGIPLNADLQSRLANARSHSIR
jgi:uncharacterized protein (DUF433 family)